MIFKEALSRQHYPGYAIEEFPHRKLSGGHQQGSASYDGQFKTTFKKQITFLISSFAFKIPDPIVQDRYWKQKLIQKILEKKQN
ncbi:hypothetical protein FGO68_gene5336 [Halteria grandinella]|uniref:Uncharacterized protein n=1 Tax=Halteria grandinella TaxID=5974 RepID=A0A8J8NAD7_HALGN|nr:hypothetical protein FGO68_gene5336 [Halteria grandinella]